MNPHSHTICGSTPQRSASNFRTIMHEAWGVPAHERLVVLAHRDTEVVLAFGTQAFGNDELVPALAGIEGVPAMGVAN